MAADGNPLPHGQDVAFHVGFHGAVGKCPRAHGVFYAPTCVAHLNPNVVERESVDDDGEGRRAIGYFPNVRIPRAIRSLGEHEGCTFHGQGFNPGLFTQQAPSIQG